MLKLPQPATTVNNAKQREAMARCTAARQWPSNASSSRHDGHTLPSSSPPTPLRIIFLTWMAAMIGFVSRGWIESTNEWWMSSTISSSSQSLLRFNTEHERPIVASMGSGRSSDATAATTQQRSTTEMLNAHRKAVASSSINFAPKLHQSVTPEQIAAFDRPRPLYVDFGLSDGSDTGFYLDKQYSVVAVDAYKPWIDQAKSRFQAEIRSHRLLLFNVGIAPPLATINGTLPESMPLYFKKEGDVIASFVKSKGCQFAEDPQRCLWVNVPVVPCEAVLQMIHAAPEIMKVDIEMLHHSCLRALHHINPAWLPKYVCWEEHDKPFGDEAQIPRPITDIKLILGLYELGYDSIKLVVQGYNAYKYYGMGDLEIIGHGQGSGRLLPDQQMHYRSYLYSADQKTFNTNWVAVNQALLEGIFGFGPKRSTNDRRAYTQGLYFDLCMKLSPDADQLRQIRQSPENIPLAWYS